MEWSICIKEAIHYMEENLLEAIGPVEVSNHVGISSMYLSLGFQILTGYTLAEYIRNRRLYEAGKELSLNKIKVIDIAYKYGYETPESFTKAFTRFHGITPLEAKKNPKYLKEFLPLHIEINIKGGNYMEYIVEKRSSFKLIGFAKEVPFENSYKEIPLFWDEVYQKYSSVLWAGKKPSTALEQAILANHIGEFGLCCAEETSPGKFKYYIAGYYEGGDIPLGLEVVEIPELEWARFKCVGPMPKALQDVNTKIFKEWLPGNKDYEIYGKYDIEWYSSEKNPQAEDYQSEIWIPIKRK
ncbi:MAG: AraC family transcriptional regulator [Anaeroplasmataceae bacterium]|nr:AraC family transcriptional regulator [Anaeroplasmataceae bacterium]MDE6414315.1 AraC family transcriptional regulator [Anaeroplasmataceae bacterium]